jgi:hypothetical protein
MADCIKIAADFVSTDNLARCANLTAEFRAQNVDEAWKEDVLQLKCLLWHAWVSLQRQPDLLRASFRAPSPPVSALNTKRQFVGDIQSVSDLNPPRKSRKLHRLNLPFNARIRAARRTESIDFITMGWLHTCKCLAITLLALC